MKSRRAQWFSFVVLTILIVGTYCWLASRFLPPLSNEPLSFLVLPMTVIAGVMAALFYPLLHQRNRSGRILWMYLGFVVSLVVYGLYLWALIPGGKAAIVLLSLLAGHMYGLPAFLAVVLTSWAMDRAFFPEVTKVDRRATSL